MSFKLTTDQVAAYDRDGYLAIENFLDDEEVELLRHTAERDRALNAHARIMKDASGKGSRLTLWHRPGEDIYGMIARSHRVVDSVETLLGGQEVYHWHSKMMLKEPRVGGAWEWHQDYGYWYHDGCLYPELLSVLIAVNQASKQNGCLQVLRGSHKIGRIDHVLTGDQAGADLERVAEAEKHCELVYCELAPGTALFFHSNTLHRSEANLSENPRWSLICCYNTRRNSPFRTREHPVYEPLEKVEDSAIKAIGQKGMAEDKEFWALHEQAEK